MVRKLSIALTVMLFYIVSTNSINFNVQSSLPSSSISPPNVKPDNSKVAGNQALDLGILDFGVSLFEAIAENDTRNVCISPIAVQTVLTAMYTGAEEQTATELLKGLHFTGVPSTDKIAKQMSQLVAPILISPVIQMSTGIYLNAEYQMQFVWGVEINQQFLTDVEQLNFTENQAAANTMNAYVSNITFDRIENLVQPKWINSNTSSVLVVAIYVNGAWQYPFDRRMEPNVPFFNDMKSCDKAMKTVNMLHVKATFNYKSHKPLEATIIEVPYNDPSFSIVIFVPHKCGTLRSLSTKLHTTFNFKDLHNILEQRVVDLYMPEFTIDYEVANMKRALETIGFHDIFSPATANFEGALEILTSSSNFAGITGPNLYIDRIVHKAVINVTQPGSMAYYKKVNLNAKKKNGTTTEPPCVTLKINRSFIFAVKHLQNVLYIGRFISPDEEEFSSSRPYMSPSSFV